MLVTDQTEGYFAALDFNGSPIVWDFVLANNFVTGIMGPLGSGKSVGCCGKLMKKAIEQEPDATGWRRTRWAVIRNTYPELTSTTINTWKDVFPEANCGPIRYSHPITHHIKVEPQNLEDADGNVIGFAPGLDCEVLFLALDSPADVKHLKSLDLTGAWINEAIEVPPEVLDMLTGRVGRYPAIKDGGATWCGIIMDTNACDDTNWWYEFAEKGEMFDLSHLEIPGAENMDFSWRFWKQPPAVLEVIPDVAGMYRVEERGFEPILIPENQVLPGAGKSWAVNPAAENLQWLRPGYYHQQISKKALNWIQRFMQAKYVYVSPGKPWVPEYNDDAMARDHIPIMKNLPLIGGIDCGGGTLNPAATIGQRGTYGDHRFLAELCVFDIGIDKFSEHLHALITERFPGMPPPKFGIDPAASTRDEIYETAVEKHLRSRGIDVVLAPTNKEKIRREALALPMNRAVNVNGDYTPGFMLDKTHCPMLRQSLGGKWCIKRLNVAGPERFHEHPDKNKWSHVGDAASYHVLTFGEHKALTQNTKPEVHDPTKGFFPNAGQRTLGFQGGVMKMGTDFNPYE